MKVARHRDRIDGAGATAIAVVHDEPSKIREVLLEGVDWPYAVVVDLERIAYRAWGLSRAPWHKIWLDPAVWRQYARLLATGHKIRGAGRDLRQLGGDFVVAPDGRLTYSRPQQRDDRPPVGELIRIVEESTDEDG